ncbi:hypothetical protein GCM10025868_16270 [Angustibacter aerolatus]|uniref:HTH tetR-type domain-containing protein n=1 Tax=Angustibacter aerolatus TaxID=1162965 RepID=A0ABQ6JF10_9ACTN|nr:helix-turn-helix domain-containing protein [Angustibacter aerolatus]GMA86377.1 hypothetical protein GCM10025868_16270 [Angustibacter aerolatus]
MARWQPGARERLVVAAVDLFADQGYDVTTVAQIAERAGVTKSTFFRHFPDKRDLLVAGQETLGRLLAEGIGEAPSGATPLEAVAAGLERASTAMGPANRELGPRIRAAVAASTEPAGTRRPEERRARRRRDRRPRRPRRARAHRAPRRRGSASWRSSAGTPSGPRASAPTTTGSRRTRWPRSTSLRAASTALG